MSEAEFDSYLSLLAKFLRLRSRQRAELADELRDHLDSRLDELLAQGKNREQAIKIALEEFGDAAVLAEDFSRLASRRTRRFVMRCTAASAAVVAAVVLLSVALAPPGPNGPGPQQVVAQDDADAAHDAAEEAADAAATLQSSTEQSVEQKAVADLDRKLGNVIPVVKFAETSLRDVLTFVGDAIDADVLIAEQALAENGVSPDEPVTLAITRTQVSARTVLEFVLQPHDLAFVNRSGVIYVTTLDWAQERLTTKVYNVRDLLENATSHNTAPPAVMGGGGGGMGGGFGGGSGGFFSITDAATALSTGVVGQLGGMGGGGMGGGLPQTPATPADDLIDAITHSTSGDWMEVQGTGGTLSLFNGLLVVRQTDEVHAQVQKLLEALREAGANQPGGSVTVPKDGVEESVKQVSYHSPFGFKFATLTKQDWDQAGLAEFENVGWHHSGPSNEGKLQWHPDAEYFRVLEVQPGSRAARGGLKVDDVILHWVSFRLRGQQSSTTPIGSLIDEPGLSTLNVVRPSGKSIKFIEIYVDEPRLNSIDTLWSLIGIRLSNVFDEEQKLRNGRRSSGELVSDVRAESTASKSGVKVGDRLLRLGDWNVSLNQLSQNELEQEIKGPTINAMLEREGKRLTVELPIAERLPAKRAESNSTKPRVDGDTVSSSRQFWPALGLKTEFVKDPAWIGGRGETVKHQTQPIGLHVVEIDAKSLGAKAGFREGDIILTWSADQWHANTIDKNLIAFDGRRIPTQSDLNLESARAHGATAIIFQATRVDESGLRELVVMKLPLDMITTTTR